MEESIMENKTTFQQRRTLLATGGALALACCLPGTARAAGAPIRVGATREPGRLRIWVEDAGEGVPEELRPRLFERFSRTDSTVGNGLGLAIARAYARSHGGDLLYAAAERGARFELIVPQD